MRIRRSFFSKPATPPRFRQSNHKTKVLDHHALAAAAAAAAVAVAPPPGSSNTAPKVALAEDPKKKLGQSTRSLEDGKGGGRSGDATGDPALSQFAEFPRRAPIVNAHEECEERRRRCSTSDNCCNAPVPTPRPPAAPGVKPISGRPLLSRTAGMGGSSGFWPWTRGGPTAPETATGKSRDDFNGRSEPRIGMGMGLDTRTARAASAVAKSSRTIQAGLSSESEISFSEGGSDSGFPAAESSSPLTTMESACELAESLNLAGVARGADLAAGSVLLRSRLEGPPPWGHGLHRSNSVEGPLNTESDGGSHEDDVEDDEEEFMCERTRREGYNVTDQFFLESARRQRATGGNREELQLKRYFATPDRKMEEATAEASEQEQNESISRHSRQQLHSVAEEDSGQCVDGEEEGGVFDSNRSEERNHRRLWSNPWEAVASAIRGNPARSSASSTGEGREGGESGGSVSGGEDRGRSESVPVATVVTPRLERARSGGSLSGSIMTRMRFGALRERNGSGAGRNVGTRDDSPAGARDAPDRKPLAPSSVTDVHRVERSSVSKIVSGGARILGGRVTDRHRKGEAQLNRRCVVGMVESVGQRVEENMTTVESKPPHRVVGAAERARVEHGWMEADGGLGERETITGDDDGSGQGSGGGGGGGDASRRAPAGTEKKQSDGACCTLLYSEFFCRSNGTEAIGLILRNEDMRLAFKEFLTVRWCVENLDFVEVVMNYQTMINEVGSRDPGALALGKHIEDMFIARGSPREVNIGQDMRERCLKSRSRDVEMGQASMATFDAVAFELILLMNHTTMRDFKESAAYSAIEACLQEGPRDTRFSGATSSLTYDEDELVEADNDYQGMSARSRERGLLSEAQHHVADWYGLDVETVARPNTWS